MSINQNLSMTKPPPYYVTDPWHFLDETGNLPDDLPGPARKLILFLAQIIEEISLLPAGKIFITSLKCRRRPGRKPCPGQIDSWKNDENDSIKWECNHCGTGGEIHNWLLMRSVSKGIRVDKLKHSLRRWTEDDEEGLDSSARKEGITCGSSLKEAYTRRAIRKSTEMNMTRTRTLTLLFLFYIICNVFNVGVMLGIPMIGCV